jgi:hypothetical protein
MRKIKILAPILILGSVGAVTCSLASCSKSDHESLSFTSKDQILQYLETNKVEYAETDYSFSGHQPEDNYDFVSNNISFRIIQNGLLFGLTTKWDDDYISFNVDLYVNHFDSTLKYINGEGQQQTDTLHVSFENKKLTSEGDVDDAFVINYDFNEGKYSLGRHYISLTSTGPASRNLYLYNNGEETIESKVLPISNLD